MDEAVTSNCQPEPKLKKAIDRADNKQLSDHQNKTIKRLKTPLQ